METLSNRVLKSLQERREKVLNGGVNSIPSPFKRFQDDFLGIEQGKYYLLTAGTKIGKTQIASFLFVYTPLLYAYNNPDKIRIKIFYYPLEETPEDIMLRFMSYLLYTMSNHKILVSTTDLKSTKEGKIVSQEIIDILNSEEYKKVIQFFENNVIFSSSTNPTGIWKEAVDYAETHGTTHRRKIEKKDEWGEVKTIETFDYYEQDDPDEYRLIFIDHLSLINEEKGMSTKQSMDKVSEYCVILRNRYKYSPVVIQQQAFSGESLEAVKSNDGRPTVAGLADSKYTARDCNTCLGLYSPFKHEKRAYKGYDVEILKDNIRFLEVLINRGGSMGGMTALYFQGAAAYFRQLPLPDTPELLEVYKATSKRNGNRNQEN